MTKPAQKGVTIFQERWPKAKRLMWFLVFYGLPLFWMGICLREMYAASAEEVYSWARLLIGTLALFAIGWLFCIMPMQRYSRTRYECDEKGIRQLGPGRPEAFLAWEEIEDLSKRLFVWKVRGREKSLSFAAPLRLSYPLYQHIVRSAPKLKERHLKELEAFVQNEAEVFTEPDGTTVFQSSLNPRENSRLHYFLYHLGLVGMEIMVAVPTLLGHTSLAIGSASVALLVSIHFLVWKYYFGPYLRYVHVRYECSSAGIRQVGPEKTEVFLPWGDIDRLERGAVFWRLRSVHSTVLSFMNPRNVPWNKPLFEFIKERVPHLES